MNSPQPANLTSSVHVSHYLQCAPCPFVGLCLCLGFGIRQPFCSPQVGPPAKHPSPQISVKFPLPSPPSLQPTSRQIYTFPSLSPFLKLASSLKIAIYQKPLEGSSQSVEGPPTLPVHLIWCNWPPLPPAHGSHPPETQPPFCCHILQPFLFLFITEEIHAYFNNTKERVKCVSPSYPALNGVKGGACVLPLFTTCKRNVGLCTQVEVGFKNIYEIPVHILFCSLLHFKPCTNMVPHQISVYAQPHSVRLHCTPFCGCAMSLRAPHLAGTQVVPHVFKHCQAATTIPACLSSRSSVLFLLERVSKMPLLFISI